METIEERAQQSAGVKDFDALRLKTFNFCFQTGYIEGATDQQAIFDKLPKVKAWVTRDKDGTIYIFYTNKPKKYDYLWNNLREMFELLTEDKLPEGINPKWEDEEPIEVELTINLKKG